MEKATIDFTMYKQSLLELTCLVKVEDFEASKLLKIQTETAHVGRMYQFKTPAPVTLAKLSVGKHWFESWLANVNRIAS